MYKVLRSGLLEFLYAFYLISGFIKGFMLAYHIQSPIDITLFSALILTIFIIFSMYKNYEIHIKFVFSIVFLLIFYTWMIFSSIYTSSEHYWLHKILYFLTNIIAFISPILLYNYFNINKFFKYFIILSTIFNIYFMVFIFPYIYTIPAFYEVHPSYLFVSLYSGFNILLLLISKIRYKFTYLTLSILLINFYTMITSGGRGGIVFTFILLLFYYLSKVNKIQTLQISMKKALKYFLLFIALSTASLMYFNINQSNGSSNGKIQLFERTIQKLNLLVEATSGDEVGASVNYRLEQINFSLNKIFDDVPHYFFGYGIGSFSKEYSNKDTREYPHNIILEILFELGIIGLFLFLIFYIYIIKDYKYTSLSWLVLFMTLNVLKSGGLTDLRLFFAILSLMLISTIAKEEKVDKLENYENFKIQ